MHGRRQVAHIPQLSRLPHINTNVGVLSVWPEVVKRIVDNFTVATTHSHTHTTRTRSASQLCRKKELRPCESSMWMILTRTTENRHPRLVQSNVTPSTARCQDDKFLPQPKLPTFQQLLLTDTDTPCSCSCLSRVCFPRPTHVPAPLCACACAREYAARTIVWSLSVQAPRILLMIIFPALFGFHSFFFVYTY